MSSSNNDETNAAMKRVAPELSSKFAIYPLQRKFWLSPEAKSGPNNDQSITAFIAHPRNDKGTPSPSLKEDYVWGPGSFGFGYYHLLTRDSYKILHARMREEYGGDICCCYGPVHSTASTGVLKPTGKDYDTVKNIMYNRSICSRPDDYLAQKEAIDAARGIAQQHYHQDQNFQLVLMIN